RLAKGVGGQGGGWGAEFAVWVDDRGVEPLIRLDSLGRQLVLAHLQTAAHTRQAELARHHAREAQVIDEVDERLAALRERRHESEHRLPVRLQDDGLPDSHDGVEGGANTARQWPMRTDSRGDVVA